MTLRPGLVGDELHAKDLLGKLLGLVDRPRDLYAAALAAASGMDLCLDDDALRAICEELLSHVQRLVERVGHLAPRHGDAVLREDVFCLILVNFHKCIRQKFLKR